MGRDSFFYKIRQKYGNIPRQYVMNFLQKQENYQSLSAASWEDRQAREW